MSSSKHGFKNSISSDRQEDEQAKDQVFGTKPPFGKIFNIKAIGIFILALILIVLGLIFIPGLL